MHDEVITRLEITDTSFTVPYHTIYRRFSCQSITVNKHSNNESPLAQIEPVILQLVVWKQEAGQPVTPTEGLLIANSLIEDKPIQEKVKDFQASRKKSPTGQLSKKYWFQFMKRHKQYLQSRKGYRVACNRTEWVTYNNVEIMYELIYEQMTNAGIAVELPEDEQYWVDKDGEELDSDENAVGLKVKIKITHPEWLLFGDEVGTEISQKDDGHVGGQRFVSQKNTRANIKSSHTNGRFTLIGLTAASGDPVMCIMIFAGEELTFEQRMGDDIRVAYDAAKSVTQNSGRGKRFPGAPTCFFRGKTIPPLVTCSKKGCITSEILMTALKRLDDLGVYKRTETLTPMGLFDAHDSRLQVPFLRYINDESHLWRFCIGLPNGTHKWQVGDAPEQNGCWKVEWSREKGVLLLYRIRMGLNAVLEKSDIITLVNIVWHKSFAMKESNTKAIAARGWNPANYCLLTDPEILATRPTSVANHTNPVTTLVVRQPSPMIPSPVQNVQTTPAPVTQAVQYSTTNTQGLPSPLPPPPLQDINTITTIPPPQLSPAPNDINNTCQTDLPPPSLSLTCNNDNHTIQTAESLASDSHTTITTQPHPSPWINLADLNFEHGLSGEFTVDILQHMVRKEKINENLNCRYERGRAKRGEIDSTRRLTGGSLFESKHIILDSEVLEYREGKEKEKEDEKFKTIQNAV